MPVPDVGQGQEPGLRPLITRRPVPVQHIWNLSIREQPLHVVEHRLPQRVGDREQVAAAHGPVEAQPDQEWPLLLRCRDRRAGRQVADPLGADPRSARLHSADQAS